MPVAHACNPRYSGGNDQEGCGLKPTPAKSLWDPISKKGGEDQGVCPEFKPNTTIIAQQQ
jgi:hypothetical protein